ncbi:MAG: hypothetical protein OXP09_07495 [Gammaproteobacteria bacterium]|nr:hypothetical protein [Gammaproteobacteria bacterium]
MDKTFDPVAYAATIGRDLVASFDAAGAATSPGLVGSARETSIRKKLQHLLPAGIAVGSGCVIDSYGATSKQLDVVLYEKHLSPVYSINDDPASTYYPCEGVIAAGEIKSTLAATDLEDAFSKVASIKKLRRYARRPSSHSAYEKLGLEPTVPFRKYGSPLAAEGDPTEQFNQDKNPFDQIFGFCLAGKLSLAANTLCERFVQLSTRCGVSLSLNLIVTLDDHIACPIQLAEDGGNATIVIAAAEADAIYCVRRPQGAFPFLLARIYTVYREGRTVEELAFDRYFASAGELQLPGGGAVNKIS